MRDEPEVNEACERVAASLKSAGVRVQIDRGRGSFGRRVTDWEIKGVPLRVEVGPRDLKEGVVSLVRRDNGEKSALSLDTVASVAFDLLEVIQSAMLADAKKRLSDATADVLTVDDAMEAAETGFARLKWSAVGESGEAKLKTQAITVRCLQRPDGSMPQNDTEADLDCIVAKSY